MARPMRVRVSRSGAAQDPQPLVAAERLARRRGTLDRALEAEVDGGVDCLVGAHRPAVLSRGVTKIVARSAARLRNT